MGIVQPKEKTEEVCLSVQQSDSVVFMCVCIYIFRLFS